MAYIKAKWKCPFCDCWFVTEEDLHAHLRAHDIHGHRLPSLRNERNKREQPQRYHAPHHPLAPFNNNKGRENK